MGKEVKGIWIYTLSDPITNQVRYVGQSSNPMVRYSQHCAAFENSTKNFWIRKLKEVGLKPVLNLIEECHQEMVFETESKYIIDYAKNGCDLFNIKAIDEWKPANFYLESRVKYQLKKMAFEKGMNESDFLNNMIDEAFAKFGYEQNEVTCKRK